MADFIEIVDAIFVNKAKYKNISDEDKIAAFYMINKKFSMQYPKAAQEFNDYNIDRASIIDLWFLKFKNVNGIPYWYWRKSPFVKDKNKKISGPDKKLLIEEFDLNENEFEFLSKNFEDEIDYELKILKRWAKKK